MGMYNAFGLIWYEKGYLPVALNSYHASADIQNTAIKR
jgi:hypothetical protein